MYSRWIAFSTASVILLSLAAVQSPANADESDCSTYLFIGARGTDEAPQADGAPLTNADYDEAKGGLGVVALSVLDLLQPLVLAADDTISSYGVRYSADFNRSRMIEGLKNGNVLFDSGTEAAWSAGVAVGASDTVTKMSTVHQACPATRFILAGYSQGADVISEAIRDSAPAVKAMVAATALFADGRFSATDTVSARGTYLDDHVGLFGGRAKWSTMIDSPVFSYCHYWDFICQGNVSFDEATGFGALDVGQAFAAHGRYNDWLGSHAEYQSDDSGDLAAIEIADALLLDSSSITLDAVDVVFLLDTTAQTAVPINELKLESEELTAAVLDATENSRFAVVEYKGHNVYDMLNPGDNDFVTRVSSEFSDNPVDVDDAIDAIVSEGGTPVPSGYAPQAAGYSGVLAATDLNWRPHARKLIVTLSGNRVGDSDPHGVERGTTIVEQDLRAALESERDMSMITVNWDDQLTAGLWNSSLGKSIVIGSNALALPRLVDLTEQGVRTPEAIVTGPRSAKVDVPSSFTTSGSRSVVSDADQVVVWQTCEVDPDPGTVGRNAFRSETEEESSGDPYCDSYSAPNPPAAPQIDEGDSYTVTFDHPGTYEVNAWVTSDGTSDEFWAYGSSTIVVQHPAARKPSHYGMTKTLTGSTLSLDVILDDPDTAEPVNYWELRNPIGTAMARYVMPEGDISLTVEDTTSSEWTLVPINDLGETAATEETSATSAVLTHETQENDATLVLHGDTTPAMEALRASQPMGPISLAGDYSGQIAPDDYYFIDFPMDTADATIDIGVSEWTATFNFHQDTDKYGDPIGQSLAFGVGSSLLSGGTVTAEVAGAPYRFQISEETEVSELNVGVLDPTASPPAGLTSVIESVSLWGPEISLRHDGPYNTDHFPAWSETSDPSNYSWENADISDIRTYIGTVEYRFDGELWIDSAGDPTATGSGISLTIYESPGSGTDEILRQFVQHGTVSFRVNGGAENVITLNATALEAETYWPSP